MKNLGLYQVWDCVGETTITGIIPAANNLVAALGFMNSYIKEKDPMKNPHNPKTLELHRVAILSMNEDGFVADAKSDDWFCEGKDILKFIQDEMAQRGVDDFILDDDKEEKKE